jgi:Na+-transporting NADH:ubiquinone oxidoreductase subunit NqrB
MSTRGLLGDPRHLQIAALGGLLAYGVCFLAFDISLASIVVVLATALLVQLVFGWAAGVPAFEPRSALISGLSLCLLLRTSFLPVAALAAVLAIGSKFVLRLRGKHIFNPTNFGIVVTVFVTGAAWVSPAQWGTSAFLGFLVACAGALVVQRALRSDVTGAFLATHAAILFGRALWLGDPLAIPMHQLQSGSLLLFAFFMISDPKTTPDARAGRVLFGVLVALLAAYFQFARYRPVAILPALFLLSPLVPLIDRVFPGRRYDWPQGPVVRPAASPRASRAEALVTKGVAHAPLRAAGRLDRVGVRVGPTGPRVLRVLRRQG